jgi:integrase
VGWLEKRCRCRSRTQQADCRCPATAVSYRAGYVHHGRKIQQTFPVKKLAERWLTTQEASVYSGEHIDPIDGRVLFVDWAAEWSGTRQAVLKNSTYISEKGRLSKHLKPYFDPFELRRITPLRIRQWVAQLEGIAPKTVRHCHALMFGIMADAVAEGLIAKNPCIGTRLPEVQRREMVVLTEPQLDQLYATVGEWWKPLVVLLALTGLRWGEAVGLKVGRVDLMAGTLRVEETLNEAGGKLVWSTPKTRSSRRQIRISPRVVDALLPLVAGKQGDEPVFLTQHGNLVRNRVFRDRIWVPALDALEWSPRPRIHDLRHTHVSQLIAAGVGLTAIQRRLGHTSIAITSDVYGSLLPSVEDDLMAALDQSYRSPHVPHELDVQRSDAGQLP